MSESQWRVTHRRGLAFVATHLALASLYLAIAGGLGAAAYEATRSFVSPGPGRVATGWLDLVLIDGLFFTLGLVLLAVGLGAVADVLGAERTIEGPVQQKRLAWATPELLVSGVWVATDEASYASVQPEDVVQLRCGRFLSGLKTLARKH